MAFKLIIFHSSFIIFNAFAAVGLYWLARVVNTDSSACVYPHSSVSLSQPKNPRRMKKHKKTKQE